MNRRESLKILASAPLLSYAGQANSEVPENKSAEFFTDLEFKLVTVLSDIILPADSRSGSASEAKVPEFIDFMMMDRPELQIPMRGGLAWLDAYSRKQADAAFVDVSSDNQRQILDKLAWPEDSDPTVATGVAFFNLFRDMVASGFWTSQIGVEDLQYQGNVYVEEWTGCPPTVLERLGVGYDHE